MGGALRRSHQTGRSVFCADFLWSSIFLIFERKKRKMEGVKTHKEYKIDHIQQQSTWDCGLTCILMILSSTARQYFIDNFNEICTEGGFGRSTWTIDLSYILRNFNVHHVYLTKIIGIDPEYYKHSFYNQILVKDESRVISKLKNAEANGITIDQRTVDFDYLILHLSEHGPIILLTNSAFLYCEICGRDKKSRTSQFTGHYVVLCGYDLPNEQVYYRNPAKTNHMCVTSFNNMDTARTAFGTDEDILLIFDSP